MVDSSSGGLRERADASARDADAPRAAAMVALGVGAALVAAAAAVGAYLNRPGSTVDIFAGAPPLFGRWEPHLGPGTAPAAALALLVVLVGPTLAARMRWPHVLGAGYLATVGWTMSLALVDGWERGFAARLTHPTEYLREVPGVTDASLMLREFADRILAFQPDSWATHVSGHPPGALLVFVWLDRLGLSGGAWAAAFCVLVGALIAVAVPVAVDRLAGRDAARAVLPFAVLLPGAIWFGVSADGMFAGVTALGVAVLAVAATSRHRPSSWLLGAVAGFVLGFSIFLSYGLVLVGTIALAVVLARRAWGVLAAAVGAALVVVAVFAASGFWWLEGYHLVVERYYQGLGTTRPYAYWVWADLAAAAVAAGPALVAGIGCTMARLSRLRPGRTDHRWGVLVLVAGGLVAIAAADLSGLSKAEVERIWLPFVVWLLPAAALLPRSAVRWWLAGQAGTAVVVNHLIWTYW